MSGNITDLTGIAKLAETEIVKAALLPVAAKTGRTVADIVEATRLLLTPVRFMAHWSERLDAWFAEAKGTVPLENQREAPARQTMLTLEAIRIEPDDSPLKDLYVKLLASLIDDRVQDRVHPAFPSIIAQLTPLEARVLQAIPDNYQCIRTPPEFDHPDAEQLYGDVRLIQLNTIGINSDHRAGQLLIPPMTSHLQAWRMISMFGHDQMYQHLGFLRYSLPEGTAAAAEGNLSRLRLIDVTTFERLPEDTQEMLDHFKRFAEKYHGVDAPGIMHEYILTPFGLDFKAACVPDYKDAEVILAPV